MAGDQNHLIEMLTHADRQSLLATARPVELVTSQVLHEAGDAIKFVYFPQKAYVALIAKVDSRSGVEVGMIGREGFVGSSIVLSSGGTTTRVVVQGGGSALQLDALDLIRMLSQSKKLKRQLDSYVNVLMSQQSTAAACLRFHHVGPRLARWLLMSQDRTYADSFHITHEFIAYMLGVRRESITAAANSLKRLGLISYTRGFVTVLDRSGLESEACSCYALNRNLYSVFDKKCRADKEMSNF